MVLTVRQVHQALQVLTELVVLAGLQEAQVRVD